VPESESLSEWGYLPVLNTDEYGTAHSKHRFPAPSSKLSELKKKKKKNKIQK